MVGIETHEEAPLRWLRASRWECCWPEASTRSNGFVNLFYPTFVSHTFILPCFDVLGRGRVKGGQGPSESEGEG